MVLNVSAITVPNKLKLMTFHALLPFCVNDTDQLYVQ